MNNAASDSPVVSVDHVWCSYGDFIAVRDVSFAVARGSIHALLGTNGAGKTTLLETIQGFRQPARGHIDVFGFDPARERTRIAARTGTMLQESGLVDEMTVAGQLELWQGLNLREDNPDRVLELVGLTHRRKVAVSALSGGERRRLDFAMALWGDPEVLVLDEPTTGLDPQSRRMVWRTIHDLVAAGSAVLLTTHYLEEAQSLAETVTILDRGRVAREGPMADVLASIPATIGFTVMAAPETVSELAAQLAGDLDASSAAGGTRVDISTSRLQEDVGRVIDWARGHDLVVDRLRSSPASLEEVFLVVADADAEAASGERTSA
ncbi:ABC transporter ATP-binding protein [Brevibacterium daeguense]|uniref:ABC transporter ATP-binding protein n=1 Tax=Brevibacterium daeguense TaxID=909936 RepID=A0ABP8EEU5_9MICO